MPEVQNVGVVDYSQYQPSQSQNENYVEDYATQPEVYDEHMAEMQAANKSRLGATILSAAIIGGLALWGGHAWGKKSAAKELDKAKDAAEAEIQKAKDTITKCEEVFENAKNDVTESVEKIAEESININKDANEVIDSCFGGFLSGKKFANNVKAATERLSNLKEKIKEHFESAKSKIEKLKKPIEDITEEVKEGVEA